MRPFLRTSAGAAPPASAAPLPPGAGRAPPRAAHRHRTLTPSAPWRGAPASCPGGAPPRARLRVPTHVPPRRRLPRRRPPCRTGRAERRAGAADIRPPRHRRHPALPTPARRARGRRPGGAAPMTHLWVRAEERPNEARAPLTPAGTAELVRAGHVVTVERSAERALPTAPYRDAGAAIAPPGSWRGAPADAVILGLKELAPDAAPLVHRHIMFGHAYKGQKAGRALLGRFRAGGGTLYDLEYLVDDGRTPPRGLRLLGGLRRRGGGAALPRGAAPAAARRPRSRPGPTPTALRRRGGRGARRDRRRRRRGVLDHRRERPGRDRGAADLLRRPRRRRHPLGHGRDGAAAAPSPRCWTTRSSSTASSPGPAPRSSCPPGPGPPPRRLRVIGDIACDPGRRLLAGQGLRPGHRLGARPRCGSTTTRRST